MIEQKKRLLKSFLDDGFAVNNSMRTNKPCFSCFQNQSFASSKLYHTFIAALCFALLISCIKEHFIRLLSNILDTFFYIAIPIFGKNALLSRNDVGLWKDQREFCFLYFLLRLALCSRLVVYLGCSAFQPFLQHGNGGALMLLYYCPNLQ